MQLGTQLAAATLLAALMALAHGLGIVGTTKLLRLEEESLKARRLDVASFGILTSMALCLFFLHLLEIGLFALFYVAVGALPRFEEALFHSASAYATLGHSREAFPESWRLVGAIEGLLGLVLIGWSTAVFVTDMNHLLRKRREGC